MSVRKWIRNRKWTIAQKLGLLVIFAIAAGCTFFAVTYEISEYIIVNQIRAADEDSKIFRNFETYVEGNGLSTGDAEELSTWVVRQGNAELEIFKDRELVYSTFYGGNDFDDVIEEEEDDWTNAVEVAFADGTADVVIFLFFPYYRQIMVAEIAGSALLALIIILLGIRRETKYICQLNEEVYALEGGDLSKPVTVRGSDEVAMLAESMDSFRRTMNDKINTIENLEKSNRNMAAEIAHDLRTPLTSLIMYLEFAQEEIRGREPQAEKYLEKARGKTVVLKDLLEENFSFATMPEVRTEELQKMPAYEALSGFLGDMAVYLESEGFSIYAEVSYGQKLLLVQREALGRIFSNLLSNITKYASREDQIRVSCQDTGSFMELRIVNTVREFEGEGPQSTKFGERIMRRLMEEMGGTYQAQERDGKYETVLRFRIAEGY